ncbi:MAG TPA: hypothetical protein VG013_24730, partial [Gemmataceae bacterium]|nr:hypothetical protein [Gemmataceae bacterium]
TPALASDTVSMIHKAEKATVWFVLPISGSMKQQIDQLPRPPAGQVPPELKPVVDAVPNAKALGVWGTLEGEKASLHVALTCADEASAKSVAGGLQSWWNANIKGLAGMAIRAALLKAPRSMQKVADELLSSTKFEYEGALAEASANAKMQSLEAVAKELPALVPQMGGFQQGGPAPGGQGFPRPGQPGGMRGGFGGQPGGFPNQPGGMRGGFPNQPIRPRQPGT